MITMAQCDNIVRNCPNFYFVEKEHQGVKFKIYSYRFADYKDFKYNKTARELRGLAFNLETGEPIWSIHKFFNINENEDNLLEDVLDKDINVYEKADGSLITAFFYKAQLFVKSKTSFDTMQANNAKDFILRNDNYFDFILRMQIDFNLQCFFEYVGPINQIVLNYDRENLILTQVRDRKTGEYIDLEKVKVIANKYGIETAKTYKISKEELLNVLNWKDVEGVVIQETNNPYNKWKLKTNWYLERHNLIGDSGTLPIHKIIKLIIDNKIDDVLSLLTPVSMKYTIIAEIQYLLQEYYNITLEDMEQILNKSKEMTRKEFAIIFKNHTLFSILIKNFGKDFTKEDLQDGLNQYVLKKTNKLQQAVSFLESIKKLNLTCLYYS
jgi:RNA ligase